MGWADKLDQMVTVDRDEYDKVKNRLLKNKRYVLTLIWDNEFNKRLREILDETLSQRGQEALSLVKQLNIKKKARLAYVLELINETTAKDIIIINEIRNKFAHIVSKSFANPEVRALCANLSTAKGRNVTSKNSYDIYSKAVLKITKCLGILKIPLPTGGVMKIKSKQKIK